MTTSRAENDLSCPSEILAVSRGKLVLTAPPDRSLHGSLRYALAFPFQAGPRTVGLMAMRMIEKTRNYGFLDGSDVILLDELKPPQPDRIFAATRNEIEKEQPGETPHLLMKSPLIGGFVPRGALRADGVPHPHAGTGFGVGQAHRLTFTDGRFSWGDPERKDMNEVYQLAYDGRTFTTRRTEVRTQNAEDPLRIADTGWSLLVTGITNAIPDDDDLLLAATVFQGDGAAVGVGVMRWARRQDTWRPVGYDPVVTVESPVSQAPNRMERCPWMEPSLARDADGSLLFSARGADTRDGQGESGFLLRVWRSVKAGQWTPIVDQPRARLNSPATVNMAADGSAYLVSNPYDATFIPETARKGRGREKLVLWPLNGERTGVERPLPIRDCQAEFGEPPASAVPQAGVPEKWMADHANGMTVRLKDGQWCHLLAYRICHSPLYDSHGTPPSPRSGCYIEEVTSRGPAHPAWSFEETP